MSIESDLERIAVSLERIAIAAEALVAARPAPAVLGETAEPEPKARKPRPRKEKPVEAEVVDEEKPVRRRRKSEPSGPTFEDVKEAFKKVNLACGSDDAKGFMDDWEIDTLNDLPEADYQEFITQATDMAAECDG